MTNETLEIVSRMGKKRDARCEYTGIQIRCYEYSGVLWDKEGKPLPKNWHLVPKSYWYAVPMAFLVIVYCLYLAAIK